MIEMIRNAREPQGRDRFACSAAAWNLLQQIGLAFDWQPKGTTYLAPANLQVAEPTRHDYRAGGPLDHKQLDDEDAMAWARALDTAKQSAQLARMVAAIETPPELTSLPTLHSLIYEFTEFAYGGAFSFAESAATARRA